MHLGRNKVLTELLHHLYEIIDCLLSGADVDAIFNKNIICAKITV